MLRAILAVTLCGLVAACGRYMTDSERTLSSLPAVFSLKPVAFATLSGWLQDPVSAAVPAFLRSCEVFLLQPDPQHVGNDYIAAGTIADWHGPCQTAVHLPPGDDAAARHFFESWFDPILIQAHDEQDSLFTGYYEVELAGSRSQQELYQTPVLGKPADLVTVDLGQFRPELKGETLVGQLEAGRLRPYPDRAHIEAAMTAATPNPALPVVAWVQDPIEAFLLHIQGAGIIHLEDSTSFRVGYAADNGHRFIGIAQRMVEEGLIPPEQAGMLAVRDWLRYHPDEASALIAENPRFIFFRIVHADGPLGAQGVSLSAGRSLAIDPRYLPLGVPLWLDTYEPNGQPLQRLVIAQDTGSAITGPVRGDFFWGHGEAALVKANQMKSKGRYYLLLPRSRSHPTAG